MNMLIARSKYWAFIGISEMRMEEENVASVFNVSDFLRVFGFAQEFA